MDQVAVPFPARSVVVALPPRRTRVTVDAVRAVLAQLGADASVRTVRAALGGGSLRDVSAALTLAKASIGERVRAALADATSSDQVLGQAIADFEGLAQRLADDVDRRLRALERAVRPVDVDTLAARLRRELREVATAAPAPAVTTTPAAPALSPDLALRFDRLEQAWRQRDTELPDSVRGLQVEVRAIVALLRDHPAAPVVLSAPTLPDALLDALQAALEPRPEDPRVDAIARQQRALSGALKRLAAKLSGAIAALDAKLPSKPTRRATKPTARTKKAANKPAARQSPARRQPAKPVRTRKATPATRRPPSPTAPRTRGKAAPKKARAPARVSPIKRAPAARKRTPVRKRARLAGGAAPGRRGAAGVPARKSPRATVRTPSPAQSKKPLARKPTSRTKR